MTVVSVLISDNLRRNGDSVVAIFTSEPKVYLTPASPDAKTDYQLTSGPDAMSQLRELVEDRFPEGRTLWDDFVSLLVQKYFELKHMHIVDLKELAAITGALFPESNTQQSS